MKKLNTYKIRKLYEHIIATKFDDEDEEFYAYNLYDLCDTYHIRYDYEDLDELDDELNDGYEITLGDLKIRRV